MTIFLPSGWDPTSTASLDSSALATPTSSWRWATVTSVGPIRIRFDGDSAALAVTPEWIVAGVSPSVGLRVWTQTFGRRVLVVGAGGPGASSAYSTTAWHASHVMTTGGATWLTTSVGVGWRNSIVLHGIGRGLTWSSTGRWELLVPTDGSAIPGYGGSAGATVAGGIIPMSAWEVLYLELPAPGSGTSVPTTNLKLVGTSTDFDLPESWLPLVARNGVSNTPQYRTITGETSDYWRVPTFQNGWLNLGATFTTAAYRKENSVVRLRGVVRSGTLDAGGGAAATIFTLPAGFRPEQRHMFASASASGGVDAHGRIDVDTDGTVKAIAGSNVFLSLDLITFRAYA